MKTIDSVFIVFFNIGNSFFSLFVKSHNIYISIYKHETTNRMCLILDNSAVYKAITVYSDKIK